MQAWMLSAALLWFSHADGKDAAAAKETLKACVRCCGSPSLVVRKLLLEAADVLTQPHIVWSGFGDGADPPTAAESAAYSAAECALLRVKHRATVSLHCGGPGSACMAANRV